MAQSLFLFHGILQNYGALSHGLVALVGNPALTIQMTYIHQHAPQQQILQGSNEEVIIKQSKYI